MGEIEFMLWERFIHFLGLALALGVASQATKVDLARDILMSGAAGCGVVACLTLTALAVASVKDSGK